MNAQELRYVKGRIEEHQEKHCRGIQEEMYGKGKDSMDFDAAAPWNITLHGFQDILARCLISSSYCWIRLPMNASISDDNMHDDGEHIKLVQDQHYLASNLKVMKMASVTTKLLTMANTSSIKKVQYASSLTDTMRTPKKSNTLQSSDSLLFSKGCCKSFNQLGNLLRTSQGMNTMNYMTGSELSMKMTIVDWFGVEKITDNPLSMSTLRVICMDQSRYSIEMTYPVLTKMLDKIPWLKKNIQVQIEFATVVEVDTVYEIIRLHRNEHTSISLLNASSSSSSSTVKKISTVELGSDAKRRKFTTPQLNRSNVVTPLSTITKDKADDSLSEMTESYFDDERMRIRALRTNQTFYQSLACGRLLTCKKISMWCSMELIVDNYEGIFFTEGFEWSIIRLSSICESRDMMLNVIPAGAIVDVIIDKRYLEAQITSREEAAASHFVAVLQAFFDPIVGTFHSANSLKIEHLCTYIGEH